MPKASILEIQRMSTEDGPGLRTTVFFKGCTLNCLWCHNPESISPHPQVHWISNQCIGCKICLEVCPEGALTFTLDGNRIDRNLCNGCGRCAEECPGGALALLGQSWEVDDLFQEILKDRAYFETSGGGVTLGAVAAIVVTLAGSLILLYVRRETLTAERSSEGLLSRDGMFFLTLVLFSMLTVSVFVGSVLPTITQVLTAKRFAAGPAWFDRVTGPQFAALMLVIGLCPLLGRAAAALKRLRQKRWLLLAGTVAAPLIAALAGFTRPISLIGFAVVGTALVTTLAEFVEGVIARRKRTAEAPLNALWWLLRRQRRKYGGYLVHTGILLMAVGVIGTRMYPFEVEETLTAGQAHTVGRYTLIFEELKRDFIDDYTSTWATVSVYRNGDYLATLEPRLNHYANTEQTVTVPALQPGVREDLYLILSGWAADGTTATFKIVVNALVNFLWLGGLIFLAGGALALWPHGGNTTGNAVALSVGLLLLFCAGWAMWGFPHGAVQHGSGRPLAGQAAPGFRLTLLDGGSVTLSDARGKVAVVNFWASWCPSCKKEMPDLQAVWEAYQDIDIVFIGVTYQDEEATTRTALAEYGTTYPVGLDTGDRIADAYGITGIPETFVIDRDGRIAYIHIGEVTGEQLAAELDSLLQK